ncbi:MAG: J domain-containing protein [Alphaproteobacteria bacterium]|nr:J domain-containing protein [Alphaproteobacteria bacterium]MBU0859443.1 J domain-containing protein [Alphaproteobacteria bacterium]
MPGCPAHGEYKAPRHRGLNEYYFFCLDHIQEYNKAWDFFSGMSQNDIEDHIVKSALWDRPTRRFDNHANLEENLKRRAWQAYHFTDKEPPKDEKPEERARPPGVARNTPEGEALLVMGLEPPLDFPKLKARYKELVKKHHPDVNPGNRESEELLKRINMAYTILKLAYEEFEQLPTR